MGDLIWITDELQAKNVDLVVLDRAIGTTTPAGKLIFHLLGAVAEFERVLGEERRNEGIERAKAQGTKFDRPRATGNHEAAALQELATQGATLKEMANTTGASAPTISRWLRANALVLRRD